MIMTFLYALNSSPQHPALKVRHEFTSRLPGGRERAFARERVGEWLAQKVERWRRLLHPPEPPCASAAAVRPPGKREVGSSSTLICPSRSFRSPRCFLHRVADRIQQPAEILFLQRVFES